jgi:hypothetical protein
MLSDQCLAQTKSRDLLVLKNGNTLAGKVIESDSSHLTLMRADHSTEIHAWSLIDSVKGLSYRGGFFSFGIGPNNVTYWSTFLYKNISSNSVAYHYKFGALRNGNWSKYAELVFIPSKPFKTRRLGVGANYYFPKNYSEPLCLYAGADINWTFVAENSDFMSVGIHPGIEYFYKNKYRFFAELDLQKAIFHINKNTSTAFLVGMRFSKEYSNFYRKLNSTHQLP